METINKLFDEWFYKVKSIKWKLNWMLHGGDLTPLIEEPFDLGSNGQLAMVDSHGRKIIITHTRYGHVILYERFFGGDIGIRYKKDPEFNIAIDKSSREMNQPWTF